MEKKVNISEQLWSILFQNHKFRYEGINPQRIGEICDENDIEVSIKDMIECIKGLMLKNSPERVMPEIVKDIFKEYVYQLKPDKTLMIYSGANDLPLSIKNFKIEVLPLTSGDEYIADRFEICKVYLEDEIKEKYKLILADLPFMVEEIYSNALDYCVKNLSEKGMAIFVFPSGITSNNKLVKMLQRYEEKGLFANAYIDLPMSTYMPLTRISTKLVVFEKEKKTSRFIAYIRNNYDLKPIINNYILNKNAKIFSQGIWVNQNEYSDYDSYENNLMNKKLSKLYGGELLLLKDVVKEINRPDKNNEFKSIDNVIYFPIIGVSEVVSATAEFTIKSQNYIQVVIDENKLLSSYVEFFYNSEKGQEIRKSYMKGAIPKFTKSNIVELPLIIPDINTQNDILKTDQMIMTLENQIKNLKNRFYKTPISYRNTQKSIKNINNEEKMEDWIEITPFPIASILRKYVIEDINEKKQETLFYFFESFALFHACILLSVVNANSMLLEEYDIFKGTEVKYFERASFGNWVILGQNIASAFRDMLSDSKKSKEGKYSKKDIALECFKTTEESLVQNICKKEIFNILKNASLKRNDWKGHSGITSEVIYESHVRELDGELQKLKLSIRDLYENIELIRASEMKYSKGMYKCKVEILTGSNSLFKKDMISINQPLDTEKIYIRIKDTDMVIEMAPLVIFKNSPSDQKNACYFYSKIEEGNTKYISYHYENQPEDTEPGEQAFDIIKKLMEK